MTGPIRHVERTRSGTMENSGNLLYLPEWSRLRGPIPGLRSGSAAVCAVTDPLG